jgi:hypothetical protein
MTTAGVSKNNSSSARACGGTKISFSHYSRNRI